MIFLTDEHNSDDFMIKNKQSIINSIYHLSRDKQILSKRIENMEKAKIRKTHMKLRMTKNGFYDQSENSSYYNNTATEQIRFKATLDEGVDDVEPIRSILNEEELFLQNQQMPPRIRKGKKIKMTKQQSYNDQNVLSLKKRSSQNQNSKSEIRNAHSFNYGAQFGRTRESFLEPDSSGTGNINLPNASNRKKLVSRHVITQEEMKTKSSGFTSSNSSALNYDNSMLHNPHRLKKSPYEILNYDSVSTGLNKAGKYSMSGRKYKKRKI